ncbi:MAG TPA: hypothetical protein VI318_13945 [Baekduia sp.]
MAAAPAQAALPQVDYTLSGPLGDNGWYVRPVTITWHITGATDLTGCVAIETLRTDTPGAQRTCAVSNDDGPVSATTKAIRIDQTPPTAVTAALARPPDAPPFYTRPVGITWSGTDATSGIAGCTTTTFAGPDALSAVPAGICKDRAGNTSPATALTLAYDGTAPPLNGLTATANPNGTIGVAWTTSPDAQTATVVRNPGGVAIMNAGPATTHALTDGPLGPSTAFTYTVTVKDAAGNATSAAVSATTPAALTSAASSSTSKGKSKSKTTNNRVLRWKAQPRAAYYNIQLYRNGKKLLSAWPTKNHYTLHETWRYAGRTHHLTAGRYRWYVWPGYGRRTERRYGRLLDKGAVSITKATN